MANSVLTVAALLACAAAPLHSQAAGETPVQVATRYIDHMRAGEWQQMAALMHSDALLQLRRMLQPLFDSPNGDEFREQLLGVASIAEASALSDTTVFANLARISTTRDSTLAQAVRTAQVQFIGELPEGRDTMHVVYRMTLTIEGSTFTQMDVFSMGRSNRGWRGLLKGDFTALAAAISNALDQEP